MLAVAGMWGYTVADRLRAMICTAALNEQIGLVMDIIQGNKGRKR